MAKRFKFCLIDPHQLAVVVRNHIDNVLILDSRSFLEYNVSHVVNAVNVGCAKLMKRRLQQDRLTIQDFLAQNCHWDVETSMDIVVYDQNTQDPNYLPPDSFMSVFLHKLLPVYNSVNVLKGGFLAFQACYPNFCEDEKTKFTPLTSLSQPCLPISDHGPTRILPFLYLGSQHDALNKEVLMNHNITYELNVSTNCPKPDFIQDAHFMRIPVIDNYSEKLLPHFPHAFQFLDKVRESGGCALVHCLAGISRSATVAIAYVMKHLKMSSDEAYRYVKAKRATISPNFNFLGQLLEYENQLQREKILSPRHKSQCTASNAGISTMCDQKFSFDYTKSSAVPFNVQSCTSLQDVPFNSCPSENRSREKNVHEGSDASEISDNDEHRVKAGEWNWRIKCIPVSSLKELNFTPCQAVLPASEKTTISNSQSAIRVANSWCVSDFRMKTSLETSKLPICSDQRLTLLKHNSDSPLFDNVLNECKMGSCKSFSVLTPNLCPLKEATSLSLSQVTFEPKEYNRSDSTSTSGLGSESSDFLESWSDYHSSCERETDILMDEEYGTVPTDDDEYQRRKMLGLEESSLYGKYDSLLQNSSLKCPVSPSDEDFVTDYSPSDKSQEFDGSDNCSSGRSSNRSSTGCGNTQAEDMTLSCLSGTCDLKSGKCDGLYRARSCPGILSHDTLPWTTPSWDHSVESSTALRTRANKSKRVENRNRYSCSSLDYMEYTSQTGLLKSCPNVPSFGTSGPDSVSHQIFRHSMIQVS